MAKTLVANIAKIAKVANVSSANASKILAKLTDHVDSAAGALGLLSMRPRENKNARKRQTRKRQTRVQRDVEKASREDRAIGGGIKGELLRSIYVRIAMWIVKTGNAGVPVVATDGEIIELLPLLVGSACAERLAQSDKEIHKTISSMTFDWRSVIGVGAVCPVEDTEINVTFYLGGGEAERRFWFTLDAPIDGRRVPLIPAPAPDATPISLVTVVEEIKVFHAPYMQWMERIRAAALNGDPAARHAMEWFIKTTAIARKGAVIAGKSAAYLLAFAFLGGLVLYALPAPDLQAKVLEKIEEFLKPVMGTRSGGAIDVSGRILPPDTQPAPQVVRPIMRDLDLQFDLVSQIDPALEIKGVPQFLVTQDVPGLRQVHFMVFPGKSSFPQPRLLIDFGDGHKGLYSKDRYPNDQLYYGGRELDFEHTYRSDGPFRLRIAVLDRRGDGAVSVRKVLRASLLVEEAYNPYKRQLVRYTDAASVPLQIVRTQESRDVIYDGVFRPYVNQLANEGFPSVVERWRYATGKTVYPVERPRIVEWVERDARRRVHFEIRDDSKPAAQPEQAPTLKINFGDGSSYDSSVDEAIDIFKRFNIHTSNAYRPVTQDHEYQRDGRYDVVVTVTSRGTDSKEAITRYHKAIRVDSTYDPRVLRQEDYFEMWPFQRESAMSKSEVEDALRAWFPGAL
jgi:hypothetical protein